MQNKRHMRRARFKPGGKKPNILTPIREGHLLERAGAFSNSAVVVAQHLDVLLGKIASPANPGEKRIMTLRSKWSNQQNTRDRILHLVKHGVKVRTGNWKESGALGKIRVRLDLSLHCYPLSIRLCRGVRSRALNDCDDQRAKNIYALEQVRIWTNGVRRHLQCERAVQFSRMRNVADAVNIGVFALRGTLSRGQLGQVTHESLNPAFKESHCQNGLHALHLAQEEADFLQIRITGQCIGVSGESAGSD